jgi:copper resistance protein C
VVKKIALVWLLIAAIASSQHVLAHAVVTNYSTNIKQVKAKKAEKFTLTFNSRVELGLSQMFLVSKGDKHTSLQMENGSGEGEVVILLPPQKAGDYALKFKVFAADGHLTEDLIHFTVTP